MIKVTIKKIWNKKNIETFFLKSSLVKGIKLSNKREISSSGEIKE